MFAKLRTQLTYANVVSTLCLFIVLGGGAYAATALPKNSVGAKQIKRNAVGAAELKRNAVTSAKVKNRSLTGADIAAGTLGKVGSATNADHANSADSATSATNSSNLGGAPANAYQKFDSTLPSGQSMSGDYGIRAPSGGTTGFIDTSASFPIPLATRIPGANIVYTTTFSAPHCTGPGNADPGYLCIYQVNSGNVTNPPSVFGFENPSPQNETGRFGFNMEWIVTGASPFSIGTWTVTAP
jgi:hypothetical protein